MTATLGYHIDNVLVDAVSVGTSTDYNFSDIQDNHTIEVTFVVDQPQQ